MWRNFFTVALRNISKNKVFTLINVSGLAIGLASSILIMLFVIKEVSFDRFHEIIFELCVFFRIFCLGFLANSYEQSQRPILHSV